MEYGFSVRFKFIWLGVRLCLLFAVIALSGAKISSGVLVFFLPYCLWVFQGLGHPVPLAVTHCCYI